MMSIESKLRLMEEIKRKNDAEFRKYSKLIRLQRLIDFLWDLWDENKWGLLALGGAMLLGQIVIWIAGS